MLNVSIVKDYGVSADTRRYQGAAMSVRIAATKEKEPKRQHIDIGLICKFPNKLYHEYR